MQAARNARRVPEEERGCAPAAARAPLRLRAAAEPPCASPSSPTSTLTCAPSKRWPRRSSGSPPTRSGASATSSATVRSRTRAASGPPARHAGLPGGESRPGRARGARPGQLLARRGGGRACWTRADAPGRPARLPRGSPVERRARRRRPVPREPARPGLGVRPDVGGGPRVDARRADRPDARRAQPRPARGRRTATGELGGHAGGRNRARSDRGAHGCSTPGRSVSRATATRTPRGCCSTSTRATPPSGAFPTTSPRTQAEIREQGLPDALAERLGYGV